MKTTMQAVVLRQPGGPEQLKRETVAIPAIRPGWSLVQIKGFGINHSEIFTRQGLSPSVTLPRILGIECVGIIAATSDDAALPIGTKVVSLMGEMGRAFDGSYAEYALLPNSQLYPLQTTLPWSEAAAIPETYYTAFGALQSLRPTATSTFLVRSGASGVGLAFLKLVKAKYPQAAVIGTSRTPEKAAFLERLGYDQGIVDQDGRLTDAVTVDRILELVGPKTIRDSFAHLRPGGILCQVGLLGGQWYVEDFDPIMDIPDQTYLSSFYSGNVTQQSLQALFGITSP